MCFSKPRIPEPKRAPPPPNPNDARAKAIEEERRALSERQGRAASLMSSLSDEEAGSVVRKKKLGAE